MQCVSRAWLNSGMFIHCPRCQSLVATDPATGVPPPRCPRCLEALAAPELSARTGTTASDTPHDGDEPASEDPEEADEPPELGEPKEPEDLVVPGVDPPAHLDNVDAVTETRSLSGSMNPESQDLEVDRQDGPDDLAGSEPVISLREARETEDPMLAHSGSRGDHVDPAHELSDATAALPSEPDTGHSAGAERFEEDASDAGPNSNPASDVTPSHALPSPEAAPTAPGFAHIRGPAAADLARSRWRLPAAMSALTVLLAVQWTVADRARLAADARWRPVVVQLCDALRCTVPPWRETTAIALLDRDVRPDVALPGVLRVSAAFRNDADWAQPWPRLRLTLSDMEGRTVGTRTFTAAEYLGHTPTSKALAGGQTAAIRMNLIEPTPRSVAFAFEFL